MASYFWVGGNGTWDGSTTTNWATVSGGGGGNGPPIATDTIAFDANSGTGICTTASGSACAIATLNSSTLVLTLGANHTMSGLFTLTLGALNLSNNILTASSIASNSANVRSIAFGTGQIILTGFNTTLIEQSAVTNMTVTGSAKVVSNYTGAIGTRTFNVQVTAGQSSQAAALSIYITGGTDIIQIGSGNTADLLTLDFTGFSGTLASGARNLFGDLVLSGTMTLTASASSTTLSRSSGTQQITCAAQTIPFPLVFGSASTTATTYVFQDTLTQGATNAFTLTAGTVKLKSGVTSTVGSFVATSGTMKYVSSTTLNTRATLSQASGTINASYLTVQDIAATGGATWNALWSSNNVNAGNNSGWTFGAAPLLNAGEYAYVLRSFTTPRRF